MKKHSSLLFALFIGGFCFSQEQKTTNNKRLPISIYTTTFNISDKKTPSYSSIKKNLNLNNTYKFVTVSFEEIDNGRFLISDTNLSTKSTQFIYDDYKRYRDEHLLKGFFEKHDLTRWDPCNFIQPNVD